MQRTEQMLLDCHDLTLEDIIIPDKCPALGIPLFVGVKNKAIIVRLWID